MVVLICTQHQTVVKCPARRHQKPLEQQSNFQINSIHA